MGKRERERELGIVTVVILRYENLGEEENEKRIARARLLAIPLNWKNAIKIRMILQRVWKLRKVLKNNMISIVSSMIMFIQ